MSSQSRKEDGQTDKKIMKGGKLPIVSCILPVYNAESYLKESIESILCQTFENFELIVIDDGSTDESSKIIQEMANADKRIKYYRQENKGISSALNFAVGMSSGVFIARMDADDISLPKRFSIQVDYLNANPSCAMVGGLAEIFPSQGDRELTTGGYHRRTNLQRFPPKISVAVHPMIMVRRDVLFKIGGYRDIFPHAEDWDLFLRVSRYGTIDNPKQVIFKYRKHNQSISVTNMAEQEKSAVLAEACAIYEVRTNKSIAHSENPEIVASIIWPRDLTEKYIKFRTFRRAIGSSDADKYSIVSAIIKLILVANLRSMLSVNHWKLRILMTGFLAKLVLADMRREFRKN